MCRDRAAHVALQGCGWEKGLGGIRGGLGWEGQEGQAQSQRHRAASVPLFHCGVPLYC